MTNILTEKVKQLNNDLKDIVYKLTGGRIDGTEQLFIALLETDVERLSKGTDYLFKKGLYERSHEISLEVAYKQQAIDELKNLSN